VYHSAPGSLSAPVAIVFGAGLYRNGTPMPVLADRVATAVDLYQRGIVEKLLLSGDNRFPEYNEPEAMRRLAVQLGVPDSALVLDYAGRRTYDTCYRARFVFGVKKAILVSQDFHLPRAVYLCDQMGIESIGVDADRRTYRMSSLVQWNLREGAASFFAILETQITHPQPLLGPMEPME
jgi:vancomycin permeability regulator SanA